MKKIPAFHTACREEANPHYCSLQTHYISLVLFSVMEATPDTGEQFRIKLPGVDSSGVQGERTGDGEREREKRERELRRKKCGGTTGSSVKLQGSALLIPASH